MSKGTNLTPQQRGIIERMKACREAALKREEQDDIEQFIQDYVRFCNRAERFGIAIDCDLLPPPWEDA
jgi:hypothetical protein